MEDVVQEICLRAFRDIDRFHYQSPGSFLRWLSTIADQSIVDRVRYRDRGTPRRRRNPLPLAKQSRSAPNPPTAELPAACSRQQEAVERLLARLSRLARRTIGRRSSWPRVEGLSTAEMAERLGKSREAVALLVYRAVKRFRELSARRRRVMRRRRRDSGWPTRSPITLDRARSHDAMPGTGGGTGSARGDRSRCSIRPGPAGATLGPSDRR